MKFLPENFMSKVLYLFICSALSHNLFAEENRTYQLADVQLTRLSDLSLQKGLDTSKPVLLQFWASWCHSCGSVMWDLDEIIKQQPNSHYYSVSINDKPEDAVEAMKKHKLFLQHGSRYFIDEQKQLRTLFNVETVPTIILLNTEGKIVHRYSGHLNSESRAQFKNILKQLNSNEVVAR